MNTKIYFEERRFSMFKKFLSSVGIGAAKVDTKIHRSSFFPGETIEGVVTIKGGSTDQDVDAIYLKLMSEYEDELNDKKINVAVDLEKFLLQDSFTIAADENKEIPFSFKIPHDVPATLGKTRVWVQTGLDIKMAVDPQDRDYIEIQPHPLVGAFIESAKQLGFSLREVDCEKAPAAFRKRFPFVQEFEFKAYSGEFARKLDELEAVFYLSENKAEVLLQIDRKVRGLSSFLAESLGMDESYVRFSYSKEDTGDLTNTLANMIRKYA